MTRLPANFTEIINTPRGDKSALNDIFELLYQDLISLDRALNKLEIIDPRGSQIIVLRFLGSSK